MPLEEWKSKSESKLRVRFSANEGNEAIWACQNVHDEMDLSLVLGVIHQEDGNPMAQVLQ